MHDVLFRNPLRLEPADLRRFDSDLAAGTVRARIEGDVQTGLESGVDGTPSLFIDGRRYQGPRDATA